MDVMAIELVRDFAATEGLDFVVLFGSQARGETGPESDIDLALMPAGDQNRDAITTGWGSSWTRIVRDASG